MSRTIQDQIAQMDWPALRKHYREENHKQVVRVEGLRADKHTGDTRGKDRLSAMGDWDNPTFDLNHDYGLERELQDLNRDAELLSQSEGVRHIVMDDLVARTFTPAIPGNIELMSEQELDRQLQEIVGRGE